MVQYAGQTTSDGQIAYDFPSKLKIKYMIHCTDGRSTFEEGVVMANMDKAELVLYAE